MIGNACPLCGNDLGGPPAPPPEPLTDRQREVLEVIKRHLLVKRRAPTLREIGQAIGIRSTNGVNDHIRALEKKGYVERDPMVSRGIRVCMPQAPAAAARPERPRRGAR